MSLPEALLVRESETDSGTFGRLELPWARRSWMTLELPWLGNQPDISCIPVGDYECDTRVSFRFARKLYGLKSVPSRSNVLIHAGNFAGRKDRGLISDVEGCILLGDKFGFLVHSRGNGDDAQMGIMNSRRSLNEFMAVMDGRPFLLKISKEF